MIKQTVAFDDILVKKFKILRTSILIGNLDGKEDLLKEFESTARELDKMKTYEYEEILSSKKYTTKELNDELNRLKDLITFIKNRVKERNDFIDDYIKITTNFLDDISPVKDEDKLPEYMTRLDNISEYLNNCEEINRINFVLRNLKDDLEEKYDSKAKSELINLKLENELIEEFNKQIVNNEYFSSLNYTDIDDEIAKLDVSIIDKEQVMKTFISSYEALLGAGISGADKSEYLSYVRDAKNDYYNDLEKRFILNIYKLVLDKEENYEKLYQKRQLIENILVERNNIRHELEIISINELEDFEKLAQEQFTVIKSQKNNIDSIDALISEINENELKLNDIEMDNERQEILDILEEYSVKKIEVEKIEMPQEKAPIRYEDTSISNKEPKPSNMVVKIEDPIKIDMGRVTDTAKVVMKKVVLALEHKNVTISKEKEDISENNEYQDEMREESIADREISDENIDDNVDIGSDSDISDGDGIFNDNIAVLNGNVFLDENDNNTNNDIVIPDEVFIDNDKDKIDDDDLFSIQDPFLDDNEYELIDKDIEERSKSLMPNIDKIGSVKPNNTLSKIDDVLEDDSKIVLPTMGLNDNGNKDIPIVSENYLKE